MAELITVARPYAEALFRMARDKGQLDTFSNMLAKMAAVASDAQMADTLGNPRFSLATKLDLFLGVVGEADDVGRNLASILIDSRRAQLLPPIAEHYEALKREHQQVLRVVITSALPMSDSEVQALVATLEAKRGRKVQAEVQMDASLIGGVRIQIGDEVVSASVRDQLEQMRLAIAA
jgi:F-type H+-transporting ATPase subunit delta